MKMKDNLRCSISVYAYVEYLGHDFEITRRERLKSALYLRLKKRKVFKIVKRDPLGFLKVQFVAKYQKKMKGEIKYSKKVAQCRKNSKGGPYSPVRFCILR